MTLRAQPYFGDTMLTPETNQTSLNRAIGREMRRIRNRNRWTLEQFVTRVSFDASPEMIESVENGTRPTTLAEFVNLCESLGVAPAECIGNAVRSHHAFVVTQSVRADLTALLRTPHIRFAPLRAWARTQLSDYRKKVLVLSPMAVQELAKSTNRPHHDVAQYLAGCFPSRRQAPRLDHTVSVAEGEVQVVLDLPYTTTVGKQQTAAQFLEQSRATPGVEQ